MAIIHSKIHVKTPVDTTVNHIDDRIAVRSENLPSLINGIKDIPDRIGKPAYTEQLPLPLQKRPKP